MKKNTPIQSYHRSRVRPRPARSYRTRKANPWLAGLVFIIFLILILSLGGIAEILFGLQEPGPDSPSIGYADRSYFMHPNHEFIPVSRHQEVMFFEATAYTLEDGNGDGLTATMVVPKVGRTIAVDPRIIPYGSQVIVDGHTYVAEDCGGDIVGNRLDIYMGSGSDAYKEAMEFGRRQVEVVVE